MIDLQVMKLRPSCFHWRMRNGAFIATRCVPFDAWPEKNGLFESILNVGVFLTHEHDANRSNSDSRMSYFALALYWGVFF